MEEAPKIELVREAEEPESKLESPAHSGRLNQWLASLVERGGSDLLLSAVLPRVCD